MEQTLEINRLENLYKYKILDTTDCDFEEITSLGAKFLTFRWPSLR